MGGMAQLAAGMLDPSMVDDGSGDIMDPRRRLMQALMMKSRDALSGMQNGDDVANANIVPPDESPDDDQMPSEYPATKPKQQAFEKLQRANADLAGPTDFKHKLLKSALTLAPAAVGLIGGAGAGGVAGAAEGAVGAEETRHARGEADVARATQQYQFESGQEERQRDLALREKLTMAQIASQRAYRTLLAGIQAKKVGVQEEGNEGRLAIGGYKTQINPDGTKSIVPRNEDELSAMKQTEMGLKDAMTEVAKARASAIPKQVEQALKKLDLAISNHQLAVGRFQQSQREFGINYYGIDPANGQPPPGQPMIDGQIVGTKNKMPSVIEDRAQQAQTITQTSAGLIKDIKDNAKYLGPLMGRYGSLTDMLGNPPPAYAELASQLITYIALQPAAHGFRGLRAVAEFEKSIGTPIRTPEALTAAIQGNVKGLGVMATRAGRYRPEGPMATPSELPSAQGGGGGSSVSKLKKGQPRSSAGNPPASAMPPPGSKIRDFTDLK